MLKNLLFAALILLSGVASAASFDCMRAATQVEKSICADSTLNVLDETLARNYRAITSSNIGDGARKAIRLEQRQWLKDRNRCSDRGCLVKTYAARINSVCEVPVLGGVHPVCEEIEDEVTDK